MRLAVCFCLALTAACSTVSVPTASPTSGRAIGRVVPGSFEPLDDIRPVHTWMTGREADEAAERRRCGCALGDPMCECIR